MAVMMPGGQGLLHKVSGGALGGYPNLGMSMRFSVEVEGLETRCPLGLWQSCKGLQLDLNYEKLAQGGMDVKIEPLPGKIEYSPVTLERPVYEKSSKQVQAWLEGYVRTWNDCGTAPSGGGQQDHSVTITLLDYQLNSVMSWTLRNAYPIRWNGPSLSASDTAIATETLVIQHAGFFSFNPRPTKARLSPGPGAKGTPVEFQFNPEKITLQHASELGDLSRGSKNNLTKITQPSITVSDLTFDGPDTLARCEQLLEWSSPQQVENSDEYYLPPLTFQWGAFKPGGKGPVTVTLVDTKIDYLRFDSTGRPIRATAVLTLRRNEPDTPGQQNPTSGGLPGRGGHVMVSGDTMAGVALGAYGNPARWRAVAAANQVDDPLRVRPGAVLYLPSRAELTAGGAA